MQPFIVKHLRFEHEFNSERLPIVVDSRTGIPVIETLQYTMEYLRPYKAVNTIEQFCRVMQLFSFWLEVKDINLCTRMQSKGMILQEHEINQLAELYRLKSSDFVAECRKTLAPVKLSKVVSLENARQSLRAKTLEFDEVSNDYLAIRLYMTRGFISALSDKYASNIALSNELRVSLTAAKNLATTRLQALTPPIQANPDAPMGLSSDQLSLLRLVINPTSEQNPWKSEFVRVRNQLIVEILLALGIRGGELLKIKTTDISKSGSWISVTRTPDDKEDRRQFQAQAKTYARQLPLSAEVMNQLDLFIRVNRSSIPASQRKHRFVFIANDGKPLSEHSLGDLFRDLRAHCKNLPESLTAHTLRYTHTDHLWQSLSDNKGTSEEKKQALRIHQGWSDKSLMPEKYGRRYLTDLADKASLKNQNRMIKNKPVVEKFDDLPF